MFVLVYLRVRPALALLSGALLGFLALLHGGGFGLPIVDSQLWGGLPLTLLLATGGMAGALPLGILLALGRRSRLPLLRSCCAFYIELVRGVPMISNWSRVTGAIPDIFERLIGAVERDHEWDPVGDRV